MAKFDYLKEVWGLDHTIPNVKMNFIPDPDYTIIDVDLEQADAQVVAWEADCKRLKDIFKDPLKDFHSENAFGFFEDMKGEVVERYETVTPDGIIVKATDPFRSPLKAGAHATNYRTTPPTLAKTLSCSVDEAHDFISTWFNLNPEIKEWHMRTEQELLSRGYIENKFGYRRRFLGRIDTKKLQEAQAWVPQSTVGLVINKGWDRIEKRINKTQDHVQVLMQVHDSLVMQAKTVDLPHLLPEIKDCMLVEIPYNDPLTIGVGYPALSSLAYGKVKDCSWETGLPL